MLNVFCDVSIIYIMYNSQKNLCKYSIIIFLFFKKQFMSQTLQVFRFGIHEIKENEYGLTRMQKYYQSLKNVCLYCLLYYHFVFRCYVDIFTRDLFIEWQKKS